MKAKCIFVVDRCVGVIDEHDFVLFGGAGFHLDSASDEIQQAVARARQHPSQWRELDRIWADR